MVTLIVFLWRASEIYCLELREYLNGAAAVNGKPAMKRDNANTSETFFTMVILLCLVFRTD